MGIDITSQINKKYERLTVLERDLNKPMGHGKAAYWICLCECGNLKSVSTADLKRKHVQSCGCLKSELLKKRNTKDLKDLKVGLLVVLKCLGEQNERGCFLWECECECGERISLSSEYLLSGKPYSCGCQKQSSKGEKEIENLLIDNKINFIKQYTFNDLFDKQLLRYDFAILENGKPILLIEFDGIQHFDKNSLFYSDNIVKHDKMKNNYAIENNIPLIRIPYSRLGKINIKDLLLDKI